MIQRRASAAIIKISVTGSFCRKANRFIRFHLLRSPYLSWHLAQFKRDLYDEGYDKQSIEERVQTAQRAAHHKDHNNHHNRYR